MSADYTGDTLTLGLDRTGQAAHFLHDTAVRTGTLLELRLASRSFTARTDIWIPIRYERKVNVDASDTQIQAIAHLLLATSTGDHEATFVLPGDAYLRWYDITRAPPRTLSEADRSRLIECADQIEIS